MPRTPNGQGVLQFGIYIKEARRFPILTQKVKNRHTIMQGGRMRVFLDENPLSWVFSGRKPRRDEQNP